MTNMDKNKYNILAFTIVVNVYYTQKWNDDFDALTEKQYPTKKMFQILMKTKRLTRAV